METGAVLGAIALAVGAWAVLFRNRRDDIWPRTWAIAGVLIAYSVGSLLLLDDLGETFGDIGAVEVGAGIAVGIGWLVATHVGHAIFCRLFPSFIEEVQDLYSLGVDQPASRVLGPILAMGAAEELLFRGVIQSQWGFAAGLAVYTLVQLVEGKWALVLAGFLGGAIWGGLALVTDGLVAPIVAHAIWTVSLTLLWPLRACEAAELRTPEPAAPA